MFRELIALALGLGIAGAAYSFVWYVRRERQGNRGLWLLVLAVFLFVISRYLPNFEDVFNNQTFVQHAVGGGAVSALVFWYIRSWIGQKWPIILELILLFAVVSTLGAANELIEATATWSGLYEVDGSDVWVDLLANSTGAFAGWVIIRTAKLIIKM